MKNDTLQRERFVPEIESAYQVIRFKSSPLFFVFYGQFYHPSFDYVSSFFKIAFTVYENIRQISCHWRAYKLSQGLHARWIVMAARGLRPSAKGSCFNCRRNFFFSSSSYKNITNPPISTTIADHKIEDQASFIDVLSLRYVLRIKIKFVIFKN